jgi:hypothetical protein
MPRTRTTVSLDSEVFRAVKIKAARTGKRDSQVIEEALRRDLGPEGLEDLWARVTPISEAEGLELANSELHAMREEKRAAGRR